MTIPNNLEVTDYVSREQMGKMVFNGAKQREQPIR